MRSVSVSIPRMRDIYCVIIVGIYAVYEGFSNPRMREIYCFIVGRNICGL